MNPEIPFDCSEFRVEGEKLSCLDSGGGKPPLHFFHANGFPVSVYLPLLGELARDFRVLGLSLRGQDGLSDGIRDWHSLSLDLIAFLEKTGAGPVVGVGHSIGAVATMIGACRRPELFTRLVLLDPVLLPRRYTLLLRLMRLLGAKRRFPLASRARKRRNGWASRAEALDYFRPKNLFAGWQEPFLRSYVTYGLRPSRDAGVELICPPEAEARGFESYPTDIWSWPGRLETPTLIVRGERSDALSAGCYARFCRVCPAAEGRVLKGVGHLIPMEEPEETVRLIGDFCRAARFEAPRRPDESF